MSDCNHNCENCDVKDCGERSLAFTPNKNTHIKNTVGIVSAKGGVGKSLVTSLIAIKKVREGKKVGILDADITDQAFLNHLRLKDRYTLNKVRLFHS